ncbi:hypothetical protein LQZ18_08860 [Lachnospiraceae bacterium ZAX-1]
MDPSFLLNNPQLKNISPEKLKLLMEFSQKDPKRSPKDMANSILAASTSFKEKGVGFDSGETDLIVEALKQTMSEEDKRKADMILSMMKSRRR